MILRVQNAIPAIAFAPTLSTLKMDTRYIVRYIHSRGGKGETISCNPDGHEFIPPSAISISYLANVSSCLADVRLDPS